MEKIAIEAVEKELEKTKAIEAVAENEPEKTQPIEDDDNKPVEEKELILIIATSLSISL